MTRAALPDVAAILAPLLAGVAAAERPLLLAIAERMAAERYREWADGAGDAATRAGLLACAAREDEIAARVEAIHPDAADGQARLRAAHPDLARLNTSIFAGRPLAEQLAIQAGAERLGAATWRAFAAGRADDLGRDAFLACAPLEEANAVFLESLLARS
jgi:hypothetical protein